MLCVIMCVSHIYNIFVKFAFILISVMADKPDKPKPIDAKLESKVEPRPEPKAESKHSPRQHNYPPDERKKRKRSSSK